MNSLKFTLINIINYWMLKDNVGQKFKPMDLKLKGNGYVGWFTE